MADSSNHNPSSEPAGRPVFGYAAMAHRLKLEFADQAGDVLNELDSLIETARQNARGHGQIIDAILRRGHNLKGKGGTFDFPLITLLAHRMEDYFVDMPVLDGGALTAAQCFVDHMREALEGRFGGASEADVLGALPNRTETAGPAKKQLEVLLVMPGGVVKQLIEHRFQALGYCVINAATAAAAMETVARARPDLVAATAVMQDLSGVDLACALRAMPLSRDLPFMLLTSLDRADASLAALPADVPVVRKGEDFSDNLALALEALGFA